MKALVVVVAVMAAAAGFGYHLWKIAPGDGDADMAAYVMQAEFNDLEGRVQRLDQWKGKVLVLNFWATWCGPCREEIPLLIRLQKRYGDQGLQLVGLAIDQPEKAGPFAGELGINYPVLVGTGDVLDFARVLGNRTGVLPYTVVFDRSGGVAHREVGIFKEAELEPLINRLLRR